MQKIIPEIKAALQIAKKAHEGQLRAIGQDIGLSYFDTHIMRVVKSVPEFCKPAAALHDVDEDTGVTNSALEQMKDGEDFVFSFPTMGALGLLSRRLFGGTYAEYIEQIAGASGKHGEIARRVKIADLMDNINTTTHGEISERYGKALHALLGASLSFGEI
jgi:(p)ppGpp synthase/HD superfamily hydrolase